MADTGQTGTQAPQSMHSTGSIELYLACGQLRDLEAGLYHFAPGEFGPRKLRAGDYRGLLVEATAAEPSRTYRHFGWDNGTLLANLLAMSTALHLPAKVVCGFVDAQVNRLLDVDTEPSASRSNSITWSVLPSPLRTQRCAPWSLQVLDKTARRLCRTAFTVGCSAIAIEASSSAR